VTGTAWNSTLRPGKPLERRTPLTATTGLGPGAWDPRTVMPQRRTPIRPVSSKRAAENRERHTAALAIGEADWLCGIWQARSTIGLGPLDGCARRADAFHEPLRRSQGGSITDPANRVPACNYCNGHLASTPDSELGWAKRLGLVKHSWPEGSDAA
jgi:hypothetical protein